MNAIHARGTARYHDVAAALPQASSSTLAETLHALDAAQLITRRDLSASGASLVVYAVTPSGTKLLSRLRNLLDEVHLP